MDPPPLLPPEEPLEELEDDGAPGIEEPPPLDPPAEGNPPELPRELEAPPEEPPDDPEEPPLDPEEPPLELGLEGIEDDEDCWLAHPPMRKADTELMATQCAAIVSIRLLVN